MKHLLYGTIAATMLAAAAASCANHGGSDGGTVEFRMAENGSAFRLLNSAAEYGCGDDIVFADSVNLIVPTRVFGADVRPLLDSIMSLAFDTVGTDFDAVMKEHLLSTAGGLGYAVEPVDTAYADGFNNVTGTVVNLRPGLLVYRVSTAEYQPRAAHAMTTNYYINFDMDSSVVLTFPMLFDQERSGRLIAALQTQADALEQMLGPTTITELPAHNNFMLSPSGEIVFEFQPYEVASYAQGAIRVAFYPYELADYMTPFGKNYFGLNDL